MTGALNILTSLTSLLCAFLLLRAYFRVRRRLLLWSGLCFLILTITGVFAFIDLVLLPRVDLFTYRTGSATAAMVILVIGLVWESK